MSTRLRLVALLAVLVLWAPVACGTPTAEEGNSAKRSGAGAHADGMDEVLAKLKGLDAKQRRARLVELAEAEGGSVNVYGSTNYDTAGPLLDLFEERTGVSTSYYRASSSDVLRRLMQEADADRSEADVVILNGTDMVVLADKGLVQPVNTPVAKDLMPSIVYDSWFGFYVNAFTVGWNTKRIKEPPKSWEDALTNYPGQLAMEAGDWDWFATLVQEYLVGKRGMSEEAAVDMVRQAARNSASIVDGHTLMAELLAAGEYDLAASLYSVNTRQLKAQGAPVEWEPPVEPLFLRPNGIGVHRDPQHSAAALLFLEFMLTDGQRILPDYKRTPVNVSVNGGLPEEYDTVVVPVERMLKQRKKWESLYTKIIQKTGKDPVTE